MTVRFFGGYADTRCEDSSFIERAGADGVPLGGDQLGKHPGNSTF